MNTEAKSIWQGRFDGEGEEHRRFYQAISAQADVDFSLFGFACDEGVRRNQGRIGAAAAPDAIRRQLANFALHHNIRITDKGNVSCEQGDLEGAQSVLAQKITDTLAYHSMPIIFGGGHEVAFASFKGLFDYLQTQLQTGNIGIINIDAHFDLRQSDTASSGTPFLQAAQILQQAGKSFHYLCLGIARHSNTAALFQTASAVNCRYLLDKEITLMNLTFLKQQLEDFISPLDHLYLSIDLDAFPSSIAPGVSATAARGIDLAATEHVLEIICQSGKLRLFDIAEYNPQFDIEHRTAKLAAYLTYQLITYLQTQEK